jgi:hypothetical protein
MWRQVQHVGKEVVLGVAQEKARLKAEKEAAEDKYKWATVDGRREQARHFPYILHSVS